MTTGLRINMLDQNVTKIPQVPISGCQKLMSPQNQGN